MATQKSRGLLSRPAPLLNPTFLRTLEAPDEGARRRSILPSKNESLVPGIFRHLTP
jgi:hypothetical protein